MKRIATAVPLIVTCGVAFAAEPPRCDEATKIAWYQRAVAVTGGDAAPNERLPGWCWAQNERASSAAQRRAIGPAAMGADRPETLDGASRTRAPARADGALHAIATPGPRATEN